MTRRWHPSMGPKDCRVVCDDGTIMVEDLTYGEAVAACQEFDCDTNTHTQCLSHIVEMYVGWVPVSTSVRT